MVWIINAKYVKEYQIWLRFNDNTEKIIDLKAKILSEQRKIFLPLRDPDCFKKVIFNPESDTIEWPNGVDIAPETLYQM
jgi:hypothetical protein